MTTGYPYRRPRRATSWWLRLGDLEWPSRSVRDDIRRRADKLATAGIDLAITYGFHCRFDAADHFGTLHGYLADVADVLHERGLQLWDHYTCDIVERPRDDEQWHALHRSHRHHTLLYPDREARGHQQYAGHRFDDLRTIDIRTGEPAYIPAYMTEMFCHSNPEFLEMNRAYTERLLRDVPLDGIQIDDMCDYGGWFSCGCQHCRDRFRRDYGRELPDWSDKGFWGDAGEGGPYAGGGYANPAFRDWVAMRTDAIADHVAMLKQTVGDLPLMTCCSSSGPMLLNGVALDLERMAPHLDAFMLENCGLGPTTLDWPLMDAEALQQKDIARAAGDAPALALSYTVFADGAELGWALARFWGVPNWSSHHHHRLEVDPDEPIDVTEVLTPLHAWEDQTSPLDVRGARDIAELRLVSNVLCRRAGWRDPYGREHWDRVRDWSTALVAAGIGYRIVRAGELASAVALTSGDPAAGDLPGTPLVVDGVACVTDEQHAAVRAAAAAGTPVWLCLPYGTHDGRGEPRREPLSTELAGLPGTRLLTGNAGGAAELPGLVASGVLEPRVQVEPPDAGWAVRLRQHPEGLALHLMNLRLAGTVHPTLRERGVAEVLESITSANEVADVEVTIDLAGLGAAWATPVLVAPELDAPRTPRTQRDGDTVRLLLDLRGVRFTATVQEAS